MAKRTYGEWSAEDMTNAIKEFRNGDIGLNQCCRKFEIPKKTFLRHFRGEIKRTAQTDHKLKINGRLTALPHDVEMQLVQYILRMEEMLFGLTIDDVRKLAYEILEANSHLPNVFNKEKKKAGKKWYYAFMKRHPKLSLRQPECVSIARCEGFNKVNVYGFFDILEKVVDENKIDALHIYNMDESGFSTVQKKAQRVLASKGKHQVGAISSGERGVLTTFVACTNANGNYVPPMIIYKRKRMHPSLANGAPPASLVEVSESGYIDSGLFVKWLEHFIKHVKPSVNEKVLLLLDGHTTHSKNLKAINLARENGVLLLQLPGHTTHRLQPLDIAIFKPLQTFYDQAIATWLRCNPGRKVTQMEVSSLLANAYEKTATYTNAKNGFQATGIWPVDRNVFSETDFIVSENLKEPHYIAHNNKTLGGEPSINIASSSSSIASIEEINRLATVAEKLDNEPNTSIASTPSLIVSIEDISPFPKPSPKYQKRKSKGAQKAVVLTSSPYKSDLEEAKQKQEGKLSKQKGKGTVKKIFSRAKSKASDEIQQAGPSQEGKLPSDNKFAKNSEKQQAGPSNKYERAHRLKICKNIDIVLNESEWYCFLCQMCNIEDMIQCQICNKWAHEACAGTDIKNRTFLCDFCNI